MSARQGGFTVLEMLIALGVFLFALLTVVAILDTGRGTYVRNERRADVQQHARLALSEMSKEVRMAGYFPENFASPAPDPLRVNPIHIATDRALAIHGDADGSGASGVFLFCLDGSVLRRGRGAEGDALAYWCPAGEVLAEHVTRLRFAYFDEDDAPIPGTPTEPYELDGKGPGAIPNLVNVAQRDAIRRVVITITAARGGPPGQPVEEFSLTSEVRLRNAS
jgi:type II secretory pathway pseudopilin PulG